MDSAQIIDKIKAFNNFNEMYANKLIHYVCCVNSQIKDIFFSSRQIENTNTNFLSPYDNKISDFATQLMFRIAAEVTENNLSSAIRSKVLVQEDLNKWYENNHQTVGLAAAGSCLKDYLPDAFADSEVSAGSLQTALMYMPTLVGLCSYDDTQGSHQLLRLLWCLMYHLDRNRCDSVVNFWRASQLYERLTHFDQYPWLDIFKANINPDSSAFADIKNCVRQAVQKETLYDTYEESDVVDITPSGAPIIKRYQINVYHQSELVYNWMKSVSIGAAYLTGTHPDLHERKVKKSAPAPTGCVLASTKILGAGHTFKPILDIKPNDMIINGEGGKSECSGEVVKNNHVPILYSINDDEPFMSLEHLILTASGYKCIDTKTALELNPRLRIAQLKIGDIVIKSDGTKRIPTTVEKINFASGNTALCADIHIGDGLKSYITDNGYICYANYPEITADSIIKSPAPLLDDFNLFLEENQTMLEHKFGKHAYAYISELAEKGNGPIKTFSHQPDYASICSTDHADYKIFSEVPLGFEHMSIIRGFAFFDDGDTPIPLHIKDGEIYWKTADMLGYMKLYHYGFLAKGHIIKDGKQYDFTAGDYVRYVLTCTYKDKDEDKKIGFGEYKLGYEKKEELGGEQVLRPVGVWYMPYKNGEDDITLGIVASTDNMYNSITYTISKNYQLSATANFPEGDLAEDQYEALGSTHCTSAEIEFTTLFDSLSGSGFKYSDEKQDNVKIGEIKGVYHPAVTDKISKLVTILGNHLRAGLTTDTGLRENELTMLKSAYTHTVEDLVRLPVPDNMGEIHSQIFHRTLNMAVYAAYYKNDTSKDMLGLDKPSVKDNGDLTQEQADIAIQNSDFLINKFISAYLSYVYIKKGESPNCTEEFKRIVQPLLNIDKSFDKVYYYMNGNGEKCMPVQPAYSAVTNAVYQSVYRNNVTGLDEFYLHDREGWAEKLYHRLNQKETLLGLVNMQAIQPDNPQLMHYYSMLDVLDPSNRIPIVQSTCNAETDTYSYATVLRKQVLDASLKSILGKIKIPSADDKEAVESFEKIICEFFRKYTRSIADGSFSKWDAATKKAMEDELLEMAKSYNFVSVEAMIDGIAQVAADIVGEILAMTDQSFSVRIYKYFKNHPKIAGVLTVGFYGLGIVSIVLGFNQYSQMDAKEKAFFFIAVADISIQAINDLSIITATKVFKKGFGDLVEAENAILKRIGRYDFIEAISGGKNVSQVLTRMGVTGVTDASKASKFWLQFCRVTTKLAKGFMIITVGVAMGVDIWQLVEDIRHGENPGFMVLDSLMMLADGIFLVTECISCLASAVCAAIPIVGAAAAVVGIVLALISIFVKRKPPESPMELFVNNRLVGFVNGLETPPAEWIDKHPLPKENETPLGLLDFDTLFQGSDVIVYA